MQVGGVSNTISTLFILAFLARILPLVCVE